jgi:hypothetical protein
MDEDELMNTTTIPGARCLYSDEVTLGVESLAEYLAVNFETMKPEILGNVRTDDHEFWWHRMARHGAKYKVGHTALLEMVIARAVGIVQAGLV